MIRAFLLFLTGSIFLALLIATSYAEKKPSGSKSPGAAAIKKAYVGNTWKWQKGKSGIYFAKNGTTMAVFNKAVGFGKWSVSSAGTLCNKATWHWDKNGPQSKKSKKCWKHTLAKDGKLWAHDDKENNWYEFKHNKISSGNRMKSKVNSRKKKLGL